MEPMMRNRATAAAIAVLALTLAGCAGGSFEGYVEASCAPTTADGVTACSAKQKPVPTVTETVPGPTVTETVPGPTTTVTVTATPTATATATATPTPTPTPTTTTQPPAPANTPAGPAGPWTQAFSDEFDGTTLDANKWRPNWYNEGGVMNKVGTYARNATVAGGELRLRLESSTAGALVHTDFSGGYKFPVGSYVEARVFFAGSADGSNAYNWPAWWVSSTVSDGWPSSGEHDIAEVLGVGGLGKVTVNYHSPSGAHNQGEPAPGKWANGWHTYGIHRLAGSADVYYDGIKVKSYATDDSGKPEILIFNHGKSDSRGYFTGDANAMRVDWVRAWRR